MSKNLIRSKAPTWWAITAMVLVVATFVLALLALMAGSAAGASGHTPNQAAYWGDDCRKTDYADNYGADWTASRGYRLVVLKAGQDHFQWHDVRAGQVLTTPSGKDISHAIYCCDNHEEMPTTTQPEETTTTTQPEETTTTTQPEETTTTTTTQPEETTTTTQPEETTTTTTTEPEETTTTTTTEPEVELIPPLVIKPPESRIPPVVINPPAKPQTPAPTPSATPRAVPQVLPYTGADQVALLVLGLVLMGLGIGLVQRCQEEEEGVAG